MKAITRGRGNFQMPGHGIEDYGRRSVQIAHGRHLRPAHPPRRGAWHPSCASGRSGTATDLGAEGEQAREELAASSPTSTSRPRGSRRSARRTWRSRRPALSVPQRERRPGRRPSPGITGMTGARTGRAPRRCQTERVPTEPTARPASRAVRGWSGASASWPTSWRCCSAPRSASPASRRRTVRRLGQPARHLRRPAAARLRGPADPGGRAGGPVRPAAADRHRRRGDGRRPGAAGLLHHARRSGGRPRAGRGG